MPSSAYKYGTEYEYLLKSDLNVKTITANIMQRFEEYSFGIEERPQVKEIARLMLEYKNLYDLDVDTSKRSSSREAVKKYEYQGFKFFGNAPQSEVTDISFFKTYLILALDNKITWEHYFETFMFDYMRGFRRFPTMSINRL